MTTTFSNLHRIHIGTRADINTPGGLHGVIRGLSAAQASLGMQVAILHEISDANNYRTITLAPSDLGQGSQQPRQNTALSESPLHEYHFAQTASLLRAKGKGSETHSVFHFHGPWASEGRVQGQSSLRVLAKFVVERRTYHRFAAFTAHSEAFRQVLLDKFKIPEDRVALIYPGVDTAFFAPQDREAARQILGLPDDAFIVGSLRRLVPRMGLDLLLRAAADHPDVYVAIAGEGPEQPHLRALADELGITQRVRFLGRLAEPMLPIFYSALDCSIIPSRALEGFGLVALEAMSCGTPVIASDVGGLPEALGPLAPAWVFPAGNLASLSRLITKVVEEPPAQDLLLKYAGSRSWKHCALEMEAWFETLWT